MEKSIAQRCGTPGNWVVRLGSPDIRKSTGHSDWLPEEVYRVISRFFIDRPIFATVLSIVITLAGGVSVFNLPIAQYPEVTPPTVVVTASYPGANCLTVQDTVAAPIEEQVSGVEGMMYMSSQCTNDGTYTLTVTFQPGYIKSVRISRPPTGELASSETRVGRFSVTRASCPAADDSQATRPRLPCSSYR